MPRRPTDGRKQRRYDRFAVLDYVDTYKRTHNNRSPSQRHIRAGLDMSAPSVAHNTLHRLARAGLLTITTISRGLTADLEITEAGYVELERWRAERQARAEPDTSAPQEPE